MNVRTLLAATTVATALLAVPASATPPADGPAGDKCSYASTGGSTEAWRVATIWGGPVVVVDGEGLPASGTLTCTIQVAGYRHSDPDALSVSASGTGVVAVTGTGQYEVTEYDTEVWCTQFAYDGGPTFYWTGPDWQHTEAHWTTDPDAPCEFLTYVDPGPDPVPDQIVCPALLTLAGTAVPGAVEVREDGDVYLAGTGFWDCPPYAI